MTIMAALAALAGSVALYPLFSGRTWFWSGLGAVAVVAAAGLATRHFRWPAVFGAVGGLAALHLYLTARFTASEAFLGVVPTPESLRRLGELTREGWDAANRYAAPVPPVPGILLLAVGGIGLVAVLVDLLAVRLRRAAPAGLPLLAMYSVPAAVREDSVSWVAFGVGALGYLALLAADNHEQVGGWGHLVFRSADAPARPDTGVMAAAGRRIGVAAVAVAVLIPAVTPGIHSRGMFGMGSGGGRGGTQTVTTPDPLVSLKRELTRQDDLLVLRYRSNDTDRPDYLRLYSLDRFDGDRWTYSSLQSTARDRLSDRRLPDPPGLSSVPARQVTTRITVQRQVRDMSFLPVPYAPSRVSIEGDWRVHAPSLMIYSLRDSAGGRSYTVTSIRARPTASQLRLAGRTPTELYNRYTFVPERIPREVRRLAHEVTAGAATAYDQAVMLQRWFTQTGGFQYDLTAQPPQRGSDLVDFLINNKRGYCEQFAASMALLARILGIPARVAMGYTPGTQVTPGVWEVRTRDAHAWPELYFEGAGWVRFEPTPSGAAGQGTAATPDYSEPTVSSSSASTQEEESGPTETSPEASASASPSATAQRQDDLGAQAGTGGERSGDGAPVGWIIGVLLALLLLAAPMAARHVTRRLRWAGVTSRSGGAPSDPGEAAHAAWREMRADALDHGLEWRPSDTPRAAARRLGELLELDAPASQALGRIAHAEELARYAPSRPQTPPETLRADVRTVREAIAASVGRRARLRARLLPASTMGSVGSVTRAVGGRLADAASRVEAAFRRLPSRRAR
ncbi:transglutaminase [Actinomadura sp. NBRC 104425]|nr:transglutaminase [Actinomadura sp. NBRC 104425]